MKHMVPKNPEKEMFGAFTNNLKNRLITRNRTFVIKAGGVFNKTFYIYLIVWIIFADLLLISLMEKHYQKTVIPSIVESYNDQLSFMKVELSKAEMIEKEPEKYLCYSKAEVMELIVNDTDREE